MDMQTLQKINALERRIAAMEEVLRSQGILERPPEPPKPAEVPFAEAKVTMRFRPSLSHPFTALANFECPACNLKHDQVEFFIAENGGTTVTQCSCGQRLKVKLQWDSTSLRT